jgi:hypothetical protein
MADMDQCTFGAVRPQGGPGAIRKRQIPESRARQEGDQAPLQSNALKAGFRKAVERLPAYRR